MKNKPFNKPVKYMENSRVVRWVTNTDEALYILEHRWPFVEGQAHESARQICRETLNGNGTAEKARDAFVRALEEARFDLVE